MYYTSREDNKKVTYCGKNYTENNEVRMAVPNTVNTQYHVDM